VKKKLIAIGCFLTAAGALAAMTPKNYHGRIAKRLGDMLPKYHVSQHAFDDEISRRAWTNLVTYYDFDHSVFLKSDLDRLSRRQTSLDDEIRRGDASFGFEVYNLYVERLKDRIYFATNLLARGQWDFSVNEMYRIRRKDAPWPNTPASE
jgi:carboxyl-terminal processing protease